MNQIYQKSDYKIYKVDDGYIVHNYVMPDFAHTHIKSYNCCLMLINLSIHKQMPHHLSRYLLVSLLRINTDEDYCRKIRDLLANKRQKDYYFNSQKGGRRK